MSMCPLGWKLFAFLEMIFYEGQASTLVTGWAMIEGIAFKFGFSAKLTFPLSQPKYAECVLVLTNLSLVLQKVL